MSNQKHYTIDSIHRPRLPENYRSSCLDAERRRAKFKQTGTRDMPKPAKSSEEINKLHSDMWAKRGVRS